jgi:CheY-like chemotaxis protein
LSAVKADPGQIEQVIMNLAVNARDAMPLGGQLTIETTESDLRTPLAGQGSVADPGRYVTISFSDTGTGMPPEVCARVFEPFFTTKGIGKGTGLGLAVAHGIVKQSGGTIDIYSEVGVGTTFKVRLPAINGETIATPVQELAYSTTRSETILLVEDDDNVREFVAITLESFGYSVVTAPDGKTALSLYENRNVPINLVVTDVVMPEMSGRILAETLATSNPGIKVLYLSGYTDDAVVRHGILQANVAFLQKPFSPDALARKVRDVLDQA